MPGTASFLASLTDVFGFGGSTGAHCGGAASMASGGGGEEEEDEVAAATAGWAGRQVRPSLDSFFLPGRLVPLLGAAVVLAQVHWPNRLMSVVSVKEGSGHLLSLTSDSMEKCGAAAAAELRGDGHLGGWMDATNPNSSQFPT